MTVRLHINIDHVATVRNARGTRYPDPLYAAHVCETAGADGITAHLREDRRHIRDDDVERLRASISSHFNLECAATDEMRAIAERIVPDTVTLVPERREERTTEGGLDVEGQRVPISTFISMARRVGIRPSLFIAPDERAVTLSHELGASQVELSPVSTATPACPVTPSSARASWSASRAAALAPTSASRSRPATASRARTLVPSSRSPPSPRSTSGTP